MPTVCETRDKTWLVWADQDREESNTMPRCLWLDVLVNDDAGGESGKRKVGRGSGRDGKNRSSVLSTFGRRNHFRIQFVVADIFS